MGSLTWTRRWFRIGVSTVVRIIRTNCCGDWRASEAAAVEILSDYQEYPPQIQLADQGGRTEKAWLDGPNKQSKGKARKSTAHAKEEVGAYIEAIAGVRCFLVPYGVDCFYIEDLVKDRDNSLYTYFVFQLLVRPYLLG